MTTGDRVEAGARHPDAGANGDAAVADLCFAARALAQSHPMTESAVRHRQRCFEQERERQPLPEFADWAATALLTGYCLRRVEGETAARPFTFAAAEAEPGVIEQQATELAHELRVGDPAAVTALDPTTTLPALDRLIATELDKRADNVRDQLDDNDWRDLETYIAWWVVHGYCYRAAEERAGG